MDLRIVSCILIAAVVAVTLADDHGENAVVYTRESFNGAVEKQRLFVMFYAPW